MTAEETSTINQLMELFLKSRSKGEWVNLSMESKDGNDSLIFSFGNSAGSPTEQPRAWTPPPGSTTPQTRRPMSWKPRRRKTPSQWRRDQKRMKDYLAKKESSAALKEEVEETIDKVVTVTAEEPKDEINLSVIPINDAKEACVNDLFKIEGVYKNPNFKPWSSVDPNKEVKHLWEALEKDNIKNGIEEIGEGSTCFEHNFEFWGTWKIKKPGITVEFLKSLENWPKGIKNIEVKPA